MAARATHPLLAAERLACARGGRTVFRGIGFALAPGGALAATGPNGAGKSSLLRLLAGLAAPAGGAILWDGAPVAADLRAHAARLRYLGHATGAKPALTAAEELAWRARLWGAGAEGIARALARFGMEGRADVPARYLSDGQRRRIALAALVAAPAPLWLLDEPSVGLDADGLDALEDAIAEHRRGGGIAVVATHAPIGLGPPWETLDLAAETATGRGAGAPEDELEDGP